MNTLLIIIVVILGIGAIAQLVRVFEIARDLKGETDPGKVSPKDIKVNATMMLVFVFLFIGWTLYTTWKYSEFILPVAASEHGVGLDNLLYFNFLIIGIVFIVTHLLLFYFTWKYQYREDRKADYFTHSNKLELIWTIVPAIFLAVIIVYGLTTWSAITAPAPETAMNVELYPRQFDWTCRYSGADNQLGHASVRNIEGANFLGLDSSDTYGHDDKIVKGEFYLPKNKEVNFLFRSQDVIHSAYMPHFRAQMNCVPGMVTQFHFKPTMTTEEMRAETGNPDFEYYLLCNKICGAAHYNMKMVIKVVDETEFDGWLADQPTFLASTDGDAEQKEDESTEVAELIEN